jgi:PAS domain S-box-containing protein
MTENKIIKTQATNTNTAKNWILTLRWALFCWLFAVIAITFDANHLGLGTAILGLYFLSQMFFWGFSCRRGICLGINNVLFLFDINIVLLTMWYLGILSSEFSIALFLTIFMAAMARRFSYSMLIAFITCSLYIYFLLNGKVSGQSISQAQLLTLPFIVLMSAHASTLIEKAITQSCENKTLKKSQKKLTEQCRRTRNEILLENNLTRQLLESLPVAIIVVDSEGIIEAFNEEAANVFGTQEWEVLGYPIYQFEFLNSVFNAMDSQTSSSGKFPTVFKNKNGQTILRYISISKLTDPATGQIQGTVAILTDAVMRSASADTRKVMNLTRGNWQSKLA